MIYFFSTFSSEIHFISILLFFQSGMLYQSNLRKANPNTWSTMTLSIKTLSTITPSIITLSIKTLGITFQRLKNATLCIMILSIRALDTVILSVVMLNVIFAEWCKQNHYAQCRAVYHKTFYCRLLWISHHKNLKTVEGVFTVELTKLLSNNLDR